MARDKDSLGDQMKAYELATRLVLPRRTYTICRVDGRAFHTLLSGADKPFDRLVATAMDHVAFSLCNDMQGAVLAYTQSDECSILLTDFAGANSQPIFGGQVQKIVSTAAATATAAFNSAYTTSTRWGTFDARVFTIADPAEVARYFVWRQLDAVRNSVSMAAQARFSHKALQGKSSSEMMEMLFREHGINWNDYPDEFRRGRVCWKESGPRTIKFTDKRTGQAAEVEAVRSWWETGPAPRFRTDDPDGWLQQRIPMIGGEQ